jgi:hypothetical protein
MRTGSNVPAARVTEFGTRPSAFGAGSETFSTGTFATGAGSAAGAGGGVGAGGGGGGSVSAVCGAGAGGGAGSLAGGGGGGSFRAMTAGFSCRMGGGMGEGFSRTGTWLGAWLGAWEAGAWGTGAGATATVGAGAGCGAGAVVLREVKRFGSSMLTGGPAAMLAGCRTAKYTIPEASTAPVAKADTSFQFIFAPRPPRL